MFFLSSWFIVSTHSLFALVNTLAQTSVPLHRYWRINSFACVGAVIYAHLNDFAGVKNSNRFQQMAQYRLGDETQYRGERAMPGRFRGENSCRN
jgi:hypothetical protein